MRVGVAALLVFLAASLALAQPPGPPGGAPGMPPRDNRTPPAAAGTASIKGRVFAGDSGKPLRRARITVSAIELGRDQRSTSTNVDGRYELKDLPAGRYTIRVGRSGYLGLQYGQRRPLEQGKPLQLVDRQAVDNIDFTLPRASVITGRITDETNEPIADVQVSAMRSMYYQGRRRLVPAGPPARTDDAGEYRVIGLVPGSYYMMARLNETWTVVENGVEQMFGYAPTYFPGAMGMTDARRVTIGVGQQMGNTNFALIPGRAASVSGTAFDSTGRPLANRGIQLTADMVGPNMAMIMMAGNTTTAGDGTFTIRNIPPGQYHLRTQGTREGAQGQPVAEAVNMPLELSGVDVTDIALTTSSGWSIDGFVTSDNNAPPDVARDRIRIGSRPADADATPGPPPPPPGAPPPPGSPNADNGRVRDDWTFTVAGLLGAQYLRPTVPDGWAVKAILHDGRDITDIPSDGKSGNDLNGVQVVLTNKVTSLSGVLADNKGAPLTDGTVIVFADDASKWAEESRWIRAVRPDQQGQFQMKGLPPGEYMAVAVDYVEEGLWNDPEYLESLRRIAKRVTLADAQAQVLDLKVVTPSF